MENILYYFSSTGNSLKVSRDLAKTLQNTKIISIPKVINEDIEYPSKNLGIIFPVYFGALPPIVAEFTRKLDPSQIDYTFAIATCNDFPGGALHIIKKILKQNQGKLNAGFVVVMPGNYIPLYEPLSKEKQETRFKIAKEKVNSIIEAIKTNKENKLSLLGKLLTFLQKRNDNILRNRDKNFWVDENCNSCEICKKICPVQNIEIIEGKPFWLHKCQQCLACLHWCPQEAIQYDKKTIDRNRYHHPEIKLLDMLPE